MDLYLLDPTKKSYRLEAISENISKITVIMINDPFIRNKIVLNLISIEAGLLSFLSPEDFVFKKFLIESIRNLTMQYITLKKKIFEPLSIPEKEKLSEAYDIQLKGERETTSLAEGTFGCTLRVYTKEKYNLPDVIAVKIQDPKDPFIMIEEIYAAKNASVLNNYPRFNPFVINIFGFYDIQNLSENDVMILKNFTQKKCPKFHKRIQSDMRLVILEMELADQGNLKDFIKELTKDELFFIYFQLMYSIISMNSRFSLLHNDIKPDNILVSEHPVPFNYRFHQISGSQNFKFLLNMKDFPFMFKLTDFGVSNTDKFIFEDSNLEYYRYGTLNFIPPEYWLYYDINGKV